MSAASYIYTSYRNARMMLNRAIQHSWSNVSEDKLEKQSQW